MTNGQQSYILDTVEDFLTDSERAHAATAKGILDIKGYSNPDTNRVVIRATNNADDFIDHIVLDYGEQEELPECGGINQCDNDTIKLGCDGNPIAAPVYRVDDDLTEALRERFMPAE